MGAVHGNLGLSLQCFLREKCEPMTAVRLPWYKGGELDRDGEKIRLLLNVHV